MKKPKNTYWHFAQDNRRLGYQDEREIIIGGCLKVEPPIVLCERGLHASRRALDALSYAPGAFVCLVELGKDAKHDKDKSASTERTVLAALDATNILFQFSMDVAARAMERANVTHEDSWNALSIRSAHILGIADDSDLSAAWNAARNAAESAARSAARSAAWGAAWSAAWGAAWNAAESAAWDAAKNAAWGAARSAAWDAAWNAARSAEKDIQNAELEFRLLEAL